MDDLIGICGILLSDHSFRQEEKHSSIISVWAEGVH